MPRTNRSLPITASAPGAIEPGETLAVNYTVQNIGGAEGSESSINLLVEGAVEDSDGGVTLAPDESATGSFSFGDTAQYDGELLNWTVKLQDAGKTSSGQTGVGAQPGSEIVIQSIDYPSSIAPTDTLSVDYTLENLGLEDGTESYVDLKVNGTDSTFDDTDNDVTVPGGGTTSGTLTFDNVSGQFNPGDTIEFTVELWDFGDVAAGNATIETPDGPSLQLESATAPEVVETNGILTVNYTLTNNGGTNGTESAVELVINDTVEDTDTNVTVPAGDTVTGSLSFG
ncbi:MAG: hypothetical protein J07HX64_01104 [halophilic archaeon J07HX64]|nr:MAG: hypothetical protein J07HX64_01104 [halophilic archaeon J07HX64]